MHKILQFVVISALALAFAGCNLFDGRWHDSNEDNVEQADVIGDTTKTDTTTKIDTSMQAKAIQDAVLQKSKEVDDKLFSQDKEISELSETIKKIESSSEDKIDKKSAYTFMIIEFIIFVFGLAILYWLISKNKSDNNSRLDRHRKDINQLTNQSQTALPQHASSTSKEINDLKRDINQLKAKISTLEQKLRETGASNRVQVVQPSPVYPSYTQNTESKLTTENKVFYMPRTGKERSFSDEKKLPMPTDATYFKFVLKSAEKAEFYFDVNGDSNRVRKSFDDRISSIQTVCDIMNSVENPTDCKTVKPGEAELKSDGTWYVTRKAQIIYV